jgi:hypothetical protein
MLRYTSIIFISIFVVQVVIAQQEIFFDNTPKDSIKIQTFSGIEVGYTGKYEPRMFQDLMSGSIDPLEYFHSIQLNYFKEYRMFSTVSLILKGGFGISPTPDFITSSPMDGTILGYKFYNRYGIILSAEPRWYYGLKKRFVDGKAKLNSGGFFTMPLEYNSYTYPDHYSHVTIHLSPQWGFREALFSEFFIEGMLGCSLSTQQNLYSNGIDKVIHLYPTVSLKIGYVLW